jgi:Tfp pilus assembly protein PilX
MEHDIAKNNSQKGNILLSSMLILVSINLLGAGLMQSSTRELNTATFKSVDSEVFQITETCLHDVINQFESLTAKPALEIEINPTNLTTTFVGNETTTEQNKLQGYSYSCSTTYITSKLSPTGSGVSEEISGTEGEYGSSGGSVFKDYYQVNSSGSGPDNAQKNINSIISVEY